MSFYVSAPAEIAATPTTLSFDEVSVFGGDEAELSLDVVLGEEITAAVGILDVTTDTSEFSVTSYPDVIDSGESGFVVVRFDPTGDGVVSGNIVITHDGVDSPLTVPVTGTGTTDVSLTAYIFDELGFEWDIMGNGGISDGTSDAYDGAHQIYVDDEAFPWFSYGVADGREITIGPATLGSVDVTRQVYVPNDAAFARFIDLYENTTDAAVTITISMKTNLGSNGSTSVLATSSGDTVVDADDHWLVTDDSSDGFGGSDPVVVHVMSGVGGAIGVTTATVGATSTDSVAYDYELTLEPFEQAIILQFAIQRFAPDDAIAAAEELSALGGSALDGMTENELALLVNFDPDAVPSTEEATVYLYGGWTLLSLPAPSPQGTLAGLGDFDVDTINGWDATAQAYETVTSESLEHVGKGYFVHRDSALDAVDATLDVDVDADEAAAVDLTVEAGWNLVGVAAGGLTPADVTDIPNTVFGWDGAGYAVANQLLPYQGYWPYNPGAAYDLTLTQLRYRTAPNATPLAAAPEPAWETALRVSASGGGGSTLRIGSDDRARAGYDAMDIAAPPVPRVRAYASLHALEDGTAGRLSRSIVPTAGGSATWPLRASLSSAGTVTWGGVELAQGEGLRLHLDGRSYDLTRPGSADVRAGVHDMQARLIRVGPSNTRLLANYPNPFNPETWIPFELREASDVRVRIYAVDGVLVRRLDLGHRAAGFYTTRADAAYWDGRNAIGERVAGGIYLYELQAAGQSQIRRMLVLK